MKAFSEEWLNTLAETLKKDDEYQKKAKGYDSDFQIIVLPDEKSGIMETKAFGFYLPDFSNTWMGVHDESPIVLSARYDVMHKIMLGKLNAVTAIMTRKAKVKGPLQKVLKYNAATNRFVKVMQSIPCEFDGGYETLK